MAPRAANFCFSISRDFMQDVNVVVVFDSTDGATEKLALAAAVGAVQGRANIRLRRSSGTPESREYVVPREADAVWADAVISGCRSECGFESLEAFAAGKLVGKVGSALRQGAGNAGIYGAMCGAGFVTIPVAPGGADELECARMQGRRVAEMARALKNMPSVSW
jgi:hypothetical protein